MTFAYIVSFLIVKDKDKEEVVSVHTYSPRLLTKLRQLLDQQNIPYSVVEVFGYNVSVYGQALTDSKELLRKIGWK